MRPSTAPDAMGESATLWELQHLLVGERPTTSAQETRGAHDGKRRRKKQKKQKKQKKGREVVSALGRLEAVRPRPQATTLAERQAGVDKLAQKADALEIELIKQDRAVEKIRRKMVEEKRKRRQMGGVKAMKIVQHNLNKQLRILENRLDKLNIRSGEVDAGNNALRSQINALRRERITFERSYKKLQRDFKTKQKQMAEILAQSDMLYEARHTALKEIEELRARANEEAEAFADEYAELDTVVAEQAQLSQLMGHRAQRRQEKDLVERIASGNLAKAEEEKLKHRLNQLTNELHKQEESISNTEKSMQSYEEAFNKLYESAGIRDMNAIVDRFVRNEDSNFAMFNHIQFINRETEREEEMLRHLEDEMEKYKKEVGRNEGNRERIVAELGNKLEIFREQSNELDKHVQANEQTLESISRATENLFFRVGCHEMQGLEGFRCSPLFSRAPVEETENAEAQSSPGHHHKTGGKTSKASGKHASQKMHRAKAGQDAGGQARHSMKETTAPASTAAAPAPGAAGVTTTTTEAVETTNAAPPSQGSFGISALALRLGDQVTEHNIMLYLGVVEQRTNEIIQQYRKAHKGPFAFKGAEKLSEAGLPIPAHPHGSSHVKIHAPACRTKPAKRKEGKSGRFDPEDDDIEGDERPLSSQQLREITMRENLPVQSQASSSHFF